jgi:hypothetical protein
MSDSRTEIAQLVGIDPQALRDLKASLVDALVRKGVLVTLHIGRWRARHKLDPEDLGLDPRTSDAIFRSIELGHKLLLPRATLDRLSRLESKGRANLARHALDTRIGSFVPADGFPQFRESHDQLKAQYLALRDHLAEMAPALKADAAERFDQAAREVYPRVAAEIGRDEFIERYVDRALAGWPDVQEMHRSFRFDYEVSHVPLLSELASEQARQAEIQQDLALRTELQRHVAERRRREIDDFLTGIIGQLRGIVYETVTAAIRSLERHGRPLPATIVSLRHLIDRVRALNVYGDRDINSQISQLEQALGPRRRRGRITVPPLEQALLRLQDTCRDAVSEAFTVDPLLARFSAIDLNGARDAAREPAAENMVPLLGGIGA